MVGVFDMRCFQILQRNSFQGGRLTEGKEEKDKMYDRNEESGNKGQQVTTCV